MVVADDAEVKTSYHSILDAFRISSIAVRCSYDQAWIVGHLQDLELDDILSVRQTIKV
jgi:hypothetical protein